MENPYVKQFPDMLKGKTVMYVHGFGSSGQSGTVARLRTVFPNTKVVAPDLPVHPAEAQALLSRLCREEQPDLILGTSMGGMYTEQLYGYDRICMNPALCIADTMAAHGLTGIQQFQNPRQDGIQEFYVDKAMVKEYRTVSEQRFSGLKGGNDVASNGTGSNGTGSDGRDSGLGDAADERQRVYGLFGDKDDVVDTYDLFREHYPQAIHFHGGHRMDDRSFMHSVVPVIRWIDDRQEGRQRPIVYIGVECLTDAYRKPASSSQKAVRQLIETYQVYFVADDPQEAVGAPSQAAADPSENRWAQRGAQQQAGRWSQWLEEHIGVPAWHHTVYTHRRDLLYGDYLVSQRKEGDTMATLIHYGSDTFKTWEDIIDYFALLGGQ